jgi:hypothetical protein
MKRKTCGGDFSDVFPYPVLICETVEATMSSYRFALVKMVLLKNGKGFRKRKREGRGVFELLEGGHSSASTARK